MPPRSLPLAPTRRAGCRPAGADSSSGCLNLTPRWLPCPTASPAPFDLPGPGTGILGRVAAAGSPELVNRPADDPDASAGEAGVAALIAAPLRAGGRTIGVLGVAALEGEYAAADLKVIGAIAALVGPALAQALARDAAWAHADERRAALRREPPAASGRDDA